MTTTHSEGGGAGVHTPHTAQCTPEEKTLDGDNARPRGRPREGSPGTAHPQPECAPEEKLTVGDLVADAAERLEPLLGWARGNFTPPDMWSTDRASLSSMWAYASRGEWTTGKGAPRRAGQAYAVLVAFPVTALLAFAEWAVERPSRLAAAIVLVVLLSQFPPLSWLA